MPKSPALRRLLRRPIAAGSALLAAALVAPLLGIACGSSDPVAEIRQRQAAGDFQATVEPLRELLAERGDEPELHFLYGRALTVTGQPSLAEWPLRRAMEDPEYVVPAGLQLAYGAARAGNHATVIEVTTQILEESSENLDALLLRADSYARSSANADNEKALADVERILALDPENLDALEPKVVALLGLERYDEVGPVIDEIGGRIEEAGLGPDKEAWHCATRAIYSDDSGDTDEARRRWDACVERFPAHAEVVPKAVAFYDKTGDLERGIEVLRAALAQAPESRGYRRSLASHLSRAGKAEEASEVLREATESDSPSLAAAGWIDLAQHLQSTGDSPAAAEAAGRALELARKTGSPHPQLLLEYADLLVLAGEFERALEVADEMSVEPYAEAVRARVAQEQGRPAEALEHFEAVFRLWPNNASTRYYAALAAEAVGDFDRAVELYRYAIRVDPGATDARTRVARLHAAEGRPATAVNLLRLFADRTPLDAAGEELSMRLLARIGDAAAVQRTFERAQQNAPLRLGSLVASAAEGLRERAGPAAALRMLRGVEGIDLEDPAHADALRLLVRYAHEAGELADAEPVVAAALREHPDAAVLHEIQGLARELGGDAAAAQQAYEQALELDAEQSRALAGLGRLARAGGDLDAALAYFDRALEADPDALESRRAAAEVLLASGREQEAEERLEVLLRRHPYEGPAAAQLAALRLERDGASEQTLALARRAVRFRGGQAAEEVLGKVRERLEEPGSGQEPTASQADAAPSA